MSEQQDAVTLTNEVIGTSTSRVEGVENPLSDTTTIEPLQELESSYEQARKQLVTTSLANPLLHFQYSRGKKGVQIVGEHSDAIFERLVKNEQTMAFLASQSGQDEFDPNLPPSTRKLSRQEQEFAKEHIDKFLQTTHSGQDLQYRLINSERDARLFQEERGANALYLTLGMLHWKDSAEGKEHRSPLLLIPVTLDRCSKSGAIEIRYNGQEVEMNLALQRRFKEEFQVEIPTPRKLDKVTPSAYFHEVEKALKAAGKGAGEFVVSPDEMSTGLFSFSRYLMYRDLEGERWPSDSRPWEHPILQGLFQGGFTESTALEGPRSERKSSEHYNVLSADSSQLEVIQEARKGRSLRVWGPPGTGKSTTIVNVIANAVAEGKRVLFVSEKRAALRVVKNWLDTAGLGDVALEIHSDANRKSVTRQLRKTLKLDEPVLNGRAELQHEYSLLEDRLNEHARMLHEEIRDTGTSGYEAIGQVIQLNAEQEPALDLAHPVMHGWNDRQYRSALEYARRIEEHLVKNGAPRNSPFYGVELTRSSAPDTSQLKREICEVEEKLKNLTEKLFPLFRGLSLELDLEESDLDRTTSALAVIEELYTDNGRIVEGIDLESDDWVRHGRSINQALGTQMQLVEGLQRWKGLLDVERLEGIDLEHAVETVERYSNRSFIGKWFDGEYGDLKRAVEELGPWPEKTKDQITMVRELNRLQELHRSACKNEDLWESLLQIEVNEENRYDLRFWQKNSQLLQAVQEFRLCTEDHADRPDLHQHLLAPEEVYEQGEAIREALQAYVEYKRGRGQLFELLEYGAAAQREFCSRSILEQQELIRKWAFGVEGLEALIEYNSLLSQGGEQGIDFIAKEAAAIEHGDPGIEHALKTAWFTHLKNEFNQSNSLARGFSGEEHEELIGRLAELDRELLDANAAYAAKQHWEQIPRQGIGGQAALLHKEVSKQGGRMPIRTLLKRAGNAVQSAKPVFMMSPHTVAEHLKPGAIDFDLIIFDETSQVRPVDAFGAILRGKQLLAFGDLKQLGPTSFFERDTTFTYELDDEYEESAESILELLKVMNMPERSFEWHYRSRRPGLIELANDEFYDGRLRIFPSAEAGKISHGLDYHHVPHAIYESGTSRVNRAEAAAVANAIVGHALSRPEESLGVVAMSRPQMQAIQLELEMLRLRHPELEDFFKRHKREPFFVKNLENVQGDERDRIFISVGYGRDKDGKLSMNLGPLTHSGGERRLNVLMTRAKLGCEIFSSLDPDEPEFARSQAPAVHLLQKYLRHAKEGGARTLEDDFDVLKDQFLCYVKEQVEEAGFEVHAKVGPDGSGVDLGIVHPRDPNRYLLGLQMDGAGYVNVESARDRDLLRRQVLEQRGWKLKTLWALDWLDDPAGHAKKLVKEVEKLAKTDTSTRKERSAQLTGGRETRKLKRRKGDIDSGSLVEEYQRARLNLKHLREELPGGERRFAAREWGEALHQVVEAEGPIHREEAFKRVRQGMSYSRMTDRLSEALGFGEGYARAKKLFSVDREFYYPHESPIPVRDRSQVRGSLKDFARIPPEEVEAAILTVIRHSCGIKADQLVKATSQLFGYRKVPPAADAVVFDRLEKLELDQVVTRERDNLVLAAH